MLRHSGIQGEVTELGSKALSPCAVRVEPLIHLDSNTTEDSAETPKSNTDPNQSTDHAANDGKRGDVLIRGLYNRGMDTIIDVRVTNLDSKSNRTCDPDKVLARHEKEKKNKYLEACLKQRRSFTPFVVSTDGMLGREASNLMMKLAQKLSSKWKLPQSQVSGMIRARMSIAIARATHLCLRGSRVPANKISRKIQWEDGAGIGLFETDY